MTSTLAFFVLICVLVFVHEYGHFWAARKCGVKVLRFSIGFGKVLWRKTDRHGTEFAFSLIPLGGYVQMYNGELEFAGEPNQTLAQKSVLQRAFIVIAGPMANFLFAIVAYWAVFVAGIPTLKPVIGEVLPNTIAARAELPAELQIRQIEGRNVQDWEEVSLALLGQIGSERVVVEGHLIDEEMPRRFELDLRNWDVDSSRANPLTTLGIRPKSSVVEPIIKRVVEHSAAEKAGLQAGDEIISVNQQPFNWSDLISEVQKGEPISVEYKRAGEYKNVQIVPEKSDKDGRFLIGIQPTYQVLAEKYRTELKYDMISAFGMAIQKVGSLIQTVLQFIGNLLSGELSLKNMGGPISMAKGAGATAEIGWVYYLGFMALISVNLGVMNLFPILPLDGGQLLLLGVEAVRRKALSDKMQLKFQQIGFVVVAGLMCFALFNDLLHF